MKEMADQKAQEQPPQETSLQISAQANRPQSPEMEDLKRPENADEALKAFQPGEEVFEIDEATNKRLLRKIDLHLLPLLFLVYSLQFLDKLTLSYASVMGLKKDLKMSGSQYSWASSIFYFGYLLFEMPAGRLLQSLPLGKFTGANVIAWGIILSCHAAATNTAGILALRFLLGFFESSVTPAFALYTSQWYTKHEQGNRTAVWFCSNGTTQVLGGLIAYAVMHEYNKTGADIKPWQILFLVTGLLTIISGIAFIWYMPDNQLNARWLSPEDRILAVARIRGNQQGIGNKHFKGYQLKEALTDPLTWMFVFYSLVHSIPNGGMSGFFSQLIVSFGYTSEQSLLYGTPAGAIGFSAIYFNGWLGDKVKNRILVASAGAIIAMVGMIMIIALPLSNSGGRLAGYYITQTAPIGLVTLLSLISSNVAGYTKKTTVAALYFVGYCIGNIIGPQTFAAKDAPRYVPAEIAIVVCWGVTFLDLLLIYWYCKRQNLKKALARSQPGYVTMPNQEFLDLTDRENPEFVYTI